MKPGKVDSMEMLVSPPIFSVKPGDAGTNPSGGDSSSVVWRRAEGEPTSGKGSGIISGMVRNRVGRKPTLKLAIGQKGLVGGEHNCMTHGGGMAMETSEITGAAWTAPEDIFRIAGQGTAPGLGKGLKELASKKSDVVQVCGAMEEASEVTGAGWTAYVDGFRLEGQGSIRFRFRPEKAFGFDEPESSPKRSPPMGPNWSCKARESGSIPEKKGWPEGLYWAKIEPTLDFPFSAWVKCFLGWPVGPLEGLGLRPKSLFALEGQRPVSNFFRHFYLSKKILQAFFNF